MDNDNGRVSPFTPPPAQYISTPSGSSPDLDHPDNDHTSTTSHAHKPSASEAPLIRGGEANDFDEALSPPVPEYRLYKRRFAGLFAVVRTPQYISLAYTDYLRIIAGYAERSNGYGGGLVRADHRRGYVPFVLIF